jgi:hypothetical protein
MSILVSKPNLELLHLICHNDICWTFSQQFGVLISPHNPYNDVKCTSYIVAWWTWASLHNCGILLHSLGMHQQCHIQHSSSGWHDWEGDITVIVLRMT